MAFIDPYSGKSFETGSFTQLSASVAATGKLSGVTAAFVTKDKIPYRLTRGDQSYYFDVTKAETGSIIRKNDGTVYVPYKKKNLQDMVIGPGSYVSSAFSSTAYLQISASYAAQYANIDGDQIMVQAIEEFYPIKREVKQGKTTVNSFVGPVTASFDVLASGSTTSSYSSIDNIGYGDTHIPDFTLDFSNSTYATHWQLRFDNTSSLGFDFSSSQWVPSVLHRFRGGGGDRSVTGSEVISTNSFLEPLSGSIIGTGEFTDINGTNNNDGEYVLYGFRSRIAGDADSGSLYTFFGRSEIIVYPRGTENNISSGSFQYSAVSRAAATGSGVYKTLYYRTGTTGPSGSYSGSVSQEGSPAHSDSNLKHNADIGFYNVPGTTTTFLIQTSSRVNSGLGPTFIQDYGIPY